MERPHFLEQIRSALSRYAVVAILGPRQCGKTTLARAYARESQGPVTFLDLEDPTDLARLQDPKLALQDLKGLVVIDEIQRSPGLFALLRVLVDRETNPARFLILGSASGELIRQSSETLAGRIRFLELTPFDLSETGPDQADRLWLRGGFPRSYLARTGPESQEWRRGFIATFLERDIPNLGIRIPAPALRRFWMMIAHCHGQILNASEIGRSLGIADTTVRRYLEILAGTYMIRLLPPWHENITKRQVRAPKVYFRDSGILHSFLDLPRAEDVAGHPKAGASWEGFAMEEILRAGRVDANEAFFWAVHTGAELDLLIVRGAKRTGYEFKYTSRPAVTRSMRTALADLKLANLDVVFPGSGRFPLAEGVQAVGLLTLAAELRG